MKYLITLLLALGCLTSYSLEAKDLYKNDAKKRLTKQYQIASESPSDFNEHVPVLRALAKECESVTEIGLRSMVSSWGVLMGLAENGSKTKNYLGIDLEIPPDAIIAKAAYLAWANGINFWFIQGNDMQLDIQPVDFLFIDTLHTYCHLSYELEKFSPKVKKYIALHDTSEPWGDTDDVVYHGDYSEYPPHIDRNKRGLWLAVVDFLQNHPEWILRERRLNNHGLTILQRVK